MREGVVISVKNNKGAPIGAPLSLLMRCLFEFDPYHSLGSFTSLNVDD